MNDVLARCGENSRRLAASNGWGLIDFNGPFTALNLEVQKTNAEATLVGRDRVHPGDLGHVILAFLFLKAQGLPSLVASVELDAKAKKAVRTDACTVEGLAFAPDGLAFSYGAEALPFPVTGSYAAADLLVPLTRELNQETLKVGGLPAGSYALSIDGANVGLYDASQLSAGINLATNLLSPAQLQAQAVHRSNWDRSGQERVLRGLGQVEMGMLREKIDLSDAAARQAYCERGIEKNKENAYFRSVYSNYLLNKPRQAEIEKRIDDMLPGLWAAGKPPVRQVALKKQ